MSFAHPWFLLLLVLPVLLAWLKGRRGQPPAFVYSSVQLVRAVLNVRRSRAGAFLSALRWLVLALLIAAFAQPRRATSKAEVRASGVDIAVAVDLSGSMAAEDFDLGSGPINRLQMAKAVLQQFIERRPNDRIGLVAFATQSFIAAPLTLDHEYLMQKLKGLELGAIPPDHTAVGLALSTAINRLRELKSRSKIVILMTDGQNNAGRIAPLTAADAARALGVKVYTIGVGTRGTARMPVYNHAGRKIGYRPDVVDIDEDTLQKIAQMTGGKYYRADNSERFQAIYAEIDKLEKTDVAMKKYTRFDELFPWFIAPALGLLFVELLLRHTAFRRLP